MSFLQSPTYVSSGNFVFTRSLFDRVGGFRNFTWCTDFDFVMRSAAITEPIMVSKQLLNYRMHNTNSISSKDIHTEHFNQEIRRIIEDYFEMIVLRNLKNEPTNILAPSPYNWPHHFKDAYMNGAPFYRCDNFLAQISLCNSVVSTSSMGNAVDPDYLEPFLKTASDSAIALKSLPGWHSLHDSNFRHVRDTRVKTIKITSIKQLNYRANNIGSLVKARAKIRLPYSERLALLGVFRDKRIVAILRYDRTSKGHLEFQGFSGESLNIKDKLTLCWLDFDKTTLICRWSKLTSKNYSSKPQVKTPKLMGQFDLVQSDPYYLVVLGWGLINNELPEKFSFYLNGNKINFLPSMYPREDLKSLVKSSNSLYGFKFNIPMRMTNSELASQSVEIRMSSGKAELSLKRNVEI